MKRILVADDETNLRCLVRATLEDSEHEILEAADGLTALAMARAEKPDLVVLDWMMSGLTGLEVTQNLRECPDTMGIPVLMLSAKGQSTDRQRGMAAGAQAYLTKPFATLELSKSVARLLEDLTDR